MSSIFLQLPLFDALSMKRIAGKIRFNETSGDDTKLVFWNPKETFPSMGIGHFVWIPPGSSLPHLSDTFTEFLHYCQERQIELPEWLREKQTCPWKNRNEFEDTKNKSNVLNLRSFLVECVTIQGDFILLNFFKSLPLICEKFLEPQRIEVIEILNTLLPRPDGCFALIDYNNFKGPGLTPCEGYGCEGWGLKQVLERMCAKIWREHPLETFIESAKETLAYRVETAPDNKKDIEKTFLTGWNNRLDRYRES